LGTKLDMTLAILNGLVGDHLARTDNRLATELAFIVDGQPIAMDRASFLAAFPNATAKVAMLVHGLMCTEAVFRLPDGSDYGTYFERDFGYTPLRVRYNSGRAIADTGASLAQLLDTLSAAYPVPIEEILLIGFSMGGLVLRAACHTAQADSLPWLRLVRRAIYLGTPHRGAPLERAGRTLTRILRAVPDPYTRLIADVADARSEGLRDLGQADLRHEDRERTRLSHHLSVRDPQHPVPLLGEIQHYLVAGTALGHPLLALWFGDAMVPVASATADQCTTVASLALPPEHVRIFEGYPHVRLAHDEAVWEQLRTWQASA
jgi:pimeloyl-ACP methyl ester carboxylesterase